MRVWLVRDLEPTPMDEGNPRLLRAGMLSAALAERGHETTWFTSSFNHYSRRQRPTGDFSPQPNLTVRVLEGRGYGMNIGLGRLIHNYRFGRSFFKAAKESDERPDVIIADLPTTEAAATAVRFGRKTDVPTIVTIRDLWPDFFSDFVPPLWTPIVRLGLRPLDRQAKFACRYATSLIGISEGYLRWGQSKGDRLSDLDRIFYLGYPWVIHRDRSECEPVLTELNIPTSAKIVSFVGSWGSTYDLGLVLEAARLLRGCEEVIFVLAGDSSLRPDLEQAFRDLPNVRLPGWLDSDQVSVLLSSSDIGLLPYVRNAPQGLPNKVFEYMAYGLYQVATLPGEARGLLEATGTGVATPPASASEFANAIMCAVEFEADQRQRRRRQEVFLERFEASRIYGGLINHVEKVVDGHRRTQSGS